MKHVGIGVDTALVVVGEASRLRRTSGEGGMRISCCVSSE
jgi:hypothetical protein